MDYTLQPSLEQVTAVRIAIQLWQARDIRRKLAHFVRVHSTVDSESAEFYKRKMQEDKISKLVLSKVNGLPLPEMIKSIVRDIIKYIGYEMVTSYNEIFSEVTKPNFAQYIDRLHWTPRGTVDRQETVKSYLDDKNFHVSQRNLWVCKYGCNGKQEASAEGFIRSWNDRKRDIMKLLHLPGLRYDDFNHYFSLTHMFLFYQSTVAKFDLNSTPESRIVDMIAYYCSLPKKTVCCREMIFSCYSQMNTKQREIFLKRNSLSFLTTILSDWSRRHLFLPTFSTAVNFLNRVGFDCIFIEVARIRNEVFADVGECRKLFGKMWIDSPNRPNVYDGYLYERVLREFVSSRDAKFVRFLLNDVDDRERRLFVLDKIVHEIAKCPMYIDEGDNFDILEMFIKDLLLTDDDIVAFKVLLVYANEYFICARLMHGGKWKLVDEFVNYCLISNNRQIKSFKFSVGFDYGVQICRKWIDNNDFESINKFKVWCFGQNAGERLCHRCLLVPNSLIGEWWSDFSFRVMMSFFSLISYVIRIE